MSVTQSRLFNQIMGGLLRFIAALLISVAITTVPIVLSFNHWIGWGRCFYILIVVFSWIIIFFSLVEFYEYKESKALLVVVFFLLLVIGSSGLTISPWVTTGYDVSSGKLEQLKRGVRWENPFKQTSVLTLKPQTTTEINTALYPNHPDMKIRIECQPRLKIGTPKKILKQGNYIALFSPDLTDGSEVLQKCAEISAQKALIITGFTKADLYGRNNEQRTSKLAAYRKTLAKELRKNLLDPLEIPPKSKISVYFVDSE